MYKIDDGAWNEYTSSFNIAAEGQHVIYFYSVDNLGNVEEEKNVSVTVDNAPPATAVSTSGTKEGNVYTTDVGVQFSSYDTSSGVKYIKYRINGGSWMTYAGAFTISNDGDYTIEYYAVDNVGNAESVKSTSFTIQKNKPPVADFTWQPSQPKDTETITFNANLSHDEDGTIVSYTWEFGDGSTGTGVTAEHKYADNGTYVVKLTVKDDKGATASVEKTIIVSNKAPVASFSIEPLHPYVKQNITFNSLSVDDDGDIVNYTWEFGDGNLSYEKNPVHAYIKKGNYTVKLTITDNDGAKDEYTMYVVVKEKPQMSWLPVILIVVLLIVAILLVIIWKKRTKE